MSARKNSPGPLVSVITVVRNNASSIRKTILSVLEQDHACKEYIVIDGASTDGTVDIINNYREKIDVFVSEPDSGIYDAMNKGLKLCSGELVLFLNSGDYLADRKVLSAIAEIYRGRPGLSIIFGSMILAYSKLDIEKKINREFSRKMLMRGQQPPHPATFFKRSVLLENGGFDTSFSYSADFDLFCRLAKEDRSFITVDMPVAVFHAGGSSALFLARIETCRIIKKYFGRVRAARYIMVKTLESFVKNILQSAGILGIIHRIKKYNTVKS